MDIIQLLLITTVIFGILVGGYLLVTGSGAGKAQKRRLDALRYRHSQSTDTKVESQLNRAMTVLTRSEQVLNALPLRGKQAGRAHRV